jgi:hypothetical protein
MGISADFLVNLKRKWSRSTSNEARRTKHGGFHYGRLTTLTRNFLENQRIYKKKKKMEVGTSTGEKGF